MEAQLKKSEIKHWWVAPKCEKLQFFPLLNDCSHIPGDLVIVGHMRGDRSQHLYENIHPIDKISEQGLITTSKTLYSFEEAHDLYLQFLLLTSEPGVIIANRWQMLEDNMMIAKLSYCSNGITIMEHSDTIFDFFSDETQKTILSGYSDRLDSTVVLSPFNIRYHCLMLGVSPTVNEKILSSSPADIHSINVAAIRNECKKRILGK